MSRRLQRSERARHHVHIESEKGKRRKFCDSGNSSCRHLTFSPLLFYFSLTFSSSSSVICLIGRKKSRGRKDKKLREKCSQTSAKRRQLQSWRRRNKKEGERRSNDDRTSFHCRKNFFFRSFRSQCARDALLFHSSVISVILCVFWNKKERSNN